MTSKILIPSTEKQLEGPAKTFRIKIKDADDTLSFGEFTGTFTDTSVENAIKTCKEFYAMELDTYPDQIEIISIEEIDLKKITARMIEIEKINMQYSKETSFGNNPNGQEKEIEKLLGEWDALKIKRNLLKTGNVMFNSYEEYETAYVKKWEQIHGAFSRPDFNWVRQDWEMRIEKPELYK